jgi:hypothetical protein
MRLGIVGDLIGDSRRQLKRSPVFQSSVQLAINAEKYVALNAPVVRRVTWAVLNHAYAERTELTGSPVGYALIARMLRRRNF